MPQPPAETEKPPVTTGQEAFAPPLENSGVGAVQPTSSSALAVEAIEEAPQPVDAAPTSAANGGRWAGKVDKFGNAFDASLHLTDDKGVPAMSRGGRLMLKPGMKVAGRAKAQAEGRTGRTAYSRQPKHVRSVDVSRLSQQGSGAPGFDSSPDAPGATGEGIEAHRVTPEQQAAGAQPPVTPPAGGDAAKAALARTRAKVTIQMLQAGGRFIAGKEGTFQRGPEGDEHEELLDAWTALYEAEENLSPANPRLLAAVMSLKYFGRCATTDVGRARIEKGTTWLGSFTSKVRAWFHFARAAKAAN